MEIMDFWGVHSGVYQTYPIDENLATSAPYRLEQFMKIMILI